MVRKSALLMVLCSLFAAPAVAQEGSDFGEDIGGEQ